MMELRLEYKNEEEYLDDRYLKMMRHICCQKDVSLEADSEEDFLQGKFIRVDRAPFPTWKENEVQAEGLDDAYFTNVTEGVQRAFEEAMPMSAEREKLEKWLTVKSCKLNDCDQYIIAPCHPMARLIDCRNQEICDRFNNLPAKRDGMKYWIMRAVLQDYLKLNQSFYVYGTGQVYYSIRRNGCRRAVPWREVGTLTSVSSVRLIEKVSSWVKRNFHRINEVEPEVRIAYIGTINDQDFISEYFKENPILVEDRRIIPKIELIQLRRVFRGEQYAFERKDSGEGVKRFYNFSSLTDARELFKNFEIVLFLDESYFYKQGQIPKNLKEKGAASYVSWCLREMNRELEESAKGEVIEKVATTERQLKCNYYSQIYNRAGLWLNGYGKRETSKLGFDQELFQTIAQTVCPEHDVYLYISRGMTIGNINLPTQSICNDERYDGKKLLVYKVTGQSEAADKIDISEPMDEMLSNPPIIASLDLWKLVKSIGGDILIKKEMFFKKDGIEIDASQIGLLKNSFLNVSVRKKSSKPMLHFDLESPGTSENQEKLLMDFATGYLELCKEEREFPYVRNFLCELLISALVARADSAEGLFYAYLMKAGNFIEIDTDITKNLKRVRQEGHRSLFCIRRSIYSAIQGLDQITVRDMEKRLDILKYEFRYKYCPDINENEFLCLLDKIHQYCLDAGYTGSNLCLLTGQEERGNT